MTSMIISQQVDYPLKTLFIGIYKYVPVTVKLPVNVLSKRLKLLFVESHVLQVYEAYMNFFQYIVYSLYMYLILLF